MVCLTESTQQVMLSKVHAYYFQIQTQVQVTSLHSAISMFGHQ